MVNWKKPEGFVETGKMLVCKLKKSLDGLKQSLRQWYKRFDSYMLKIRYRRCDYDFYVYVRSLDDRVLFFLLLYVDDFLIAANHWNDIHDLNTKLSMKFDMKDLEAAKK